jgi:hypothetical protein
LALDPKPDDLIISAPLYIRQAGSNTLLSREYMQLVQSRLKKNGVFALYSHEGPPAQSSLVHATVRSVFPYMQTFRNGMLTVASNSPIDISREEIDRRLKSRDPLFREMAIFDRKGRVFAKRGIYENFDADGLPFEQGKYLITDDHPLVEYPAIAARLLPTIQAVADEAQPYSDSLY